MPTPLIDGFKINKSVPIDSKFSVTLFTDLETLEYKYSGLTTYVEELDQDYLWNGQSWRLKSGGAGGEVPIASTSVIGIVRIGENINVTAGGVISVAAPYSHPETHPASIITEDSDNRFVTDIQISTWNSKESGITSGLSTQYWRGDKTWQTLNTDAVTEGTQKYFTESKVRLTLITGVPIVSSQIEESDTILSALGKLQGQINGKEASISSGTTSQYWRGDKSWQTIDKFTVGLNNVVNIDTTTTQNISDFTDKRFITDAQKVIIQNTSGTNTGDETQATIKTKLGAASLGVDGYLTAADRSTFVGKQDALGFTPENVTNKDIDGTLAANSDTKYPSQKAVKTYSDNVLNTAKSYAEGLVVGLWDDRGSYDASVNTYPASNGSGIAGTILKGDAYTINVSGILGGTPVYIGDVIRALVDSPGQTSSNWALTSHNIGYVAENTANKDIDGTLSANSDVKYPSQKAVKTFVENGLSTKMASNATTDVVIEGSTNKYFTENRVLATVLTGISFLTNSAIQATDSILTALGKIQAQISSKLTANSPITGASKTKITYDTNGLITSGEDATTADISDSTNKRYVTDAQRTVLSNTSNTNTGDETVTTIKDKLGITTLSGSNTGDQDLSGITTSLVNKVDKITGKGLSTEDYTTAEKNKLALQSGTNTGDQDLSNLVVKNGTDRLITQVEVTKLQSLVEHYKGSYVTLTALTAAVPAAGGGDYAFVDTGVLGNAKLYVWDLQNGWIKEGEENLITSVNGLVGTVVLTTANINDSLNRRYITDSEKTVVQGISGTNTGDETTNSIIQKIGYVPEDTNSKNVPDGYVGLDSNGKVPTQYLSDALIGQVEYQGTWNASTNDPTLPDPTTSKGYYYVVRFAGTYNSVLYAVGDWTISNGVIWEKVDNTDSVTSVAGRTGAVILTKIDVGLENVVNLDTSNPANIVPATDYQFVTQLQRDALDNSQHPLSSTNPVASLQSIVGKEPTINSGTTSQYWRGDKTWQILNKVVVGLGNVDNISDINKPISTSTQTALDNKVDKVVGKGLSANDYTNFDKTKLGTIEENATADQTGAEIKNLLEALPDNEKLEATTGVKNIINTPYSNSTYPYLDTIKKALDFILTSFVKFSADSTAVTADSTVFTMDQN